MSDTATIRHQAREAAWSADDHWQRSDKNKSIILVHADAASDVWEPVVRSLVEALECSADGHEDDHARLVTEVKRLLGNGRTGDGTPS